MAKKDTPQKVLEKTAKTLQLDLTSKRINIWLKLIALFTLVGGLSISGNVISDTVNTREITLGFYTLRILVGILAISVSYGVIQRESWAIWLYALIVLIGVVFNPYAAILPALVLVYLYTQRSAFKPFYIKNFVIDKHAQVKKILLSQDNENA